MNDVVIRCPNCGTTQQTLGECEACHEAEVRYFCPNHEPGRWLDGPVCAACGARFTGRTAGVPPAPPPRARASERPRPVDVIPTPPTPPRVRRAPMPPPPREPIEADGGWVEVDDRAAWPPARRPREAREAREARWPSDIPIPSVRVGIGSVFGCLGRMMALAVVVVVLAALAFFGYCGTPMGFDAESPPRAAPAISVAVPSGAVPFGG